MFNNKKRVLFELCLWKKKEEEKGRKKEEDEQNRNFQVWFSNLLKVSNCLWGCPYYTNSKPRSLNNSKDTCVYT